MVGTIWGVWPFVIADEYCSVAHLEHFGIGNVAVAACLEQRFLVVPGFAFVVAERHCVAAAGRCHAHHTAVLQFVHTPVSAVADGEHSRRDVPEQA